MISSQIKQKNSNPWKALMPYSINDNKIFYGRDNEMSDLLSLIKYNQVVTLYGKSGVGKSSLLYAGVCPRLSLNGLHPYTIRLKDNDRFTEENVPFAEIILSQINDDNNLAYDSKSVFCDFFNLYESYDNYGEKVIPVIILDQFEDLLIENSNKTEVLLKQIIEWTNNKSEISSNCHFVISIREDDLYLLEEVLDKNRFNSLKLNRYRLRSITRSGAEDIIRKPGENLIQDDRVVEKILDSVSGNSNNGYEASELSLMCSQLYSSMVKKNLNHISIDLVNNCASSSIQEYYKNIIDSLKFSKNEIESFENEFVTDTGRRNFISEDRYLKLFGPRICEALLNPESEFRILTKVNGRIEIIHDLLANAVKVFKDEHRSAYLEQMKKNEKIICYLSFLPSVSIILAVINIFLIPLLEFIKDKDIKHIDIFPGILDKGVYITVGSLLLLWFAHWLILKRSKWIKNINFNETYNAASRLFIGIILCNIWWIYNHNSLTEWAYGINILPFFALGLWMRHNLIFLTVAIAYSIFPILGYPIEFDYFSILFVVLFLFYTNIIKVKSKIWILIVSIIIGILLFKDNNLKEYIFIAAIVLTIIAIIVNYRKQIPLCILFNLILLGSILCVFKTNPLLLVKHHRNLQHIIPNYCFTTINSDSIYIHDSWSGKRLNNWPILVEEGCTFGILPVKKTDFDTTRGSMWTFYPLIKNIENKGIELHISETFFKGIEIDNLKKELENKLSLISDNPENNNYTPYYHVIEDILHPIKINVSEMFHGVMSAVSKNIKDSISLSEYPNTQYWEIDSLCKAYLNEFKTKITTVRITEKDIYFYYRITACQIANALIQESISKNDIHNTLNHINFMVYLNLSENNLYSNINVSFKGKINTSLKYNFEINGNIIDNEFNITKIKDIFLFAISAAEFDNLYNSLNELKDINSFTLDKQTVINRNTKINYIKSGENNIFIKNFCYYQGSLLMDIIENMKEENKVYKSYFEEIINDLVTIQKTDSESLLRRLHESKIEELKTEVKNYEEKISNWDKKFQELEDRSNEYLKLIEEYDEIKNQINQLTKKQNKLIQPHLHN